MDVDAARVLGGMEAEDDDQGRRLFIYGTRICVMTVKKSFREFLSNYQAAELADDERGMNVNEDVRVDLNPHSSMSIFFAGT